MKYLDSDISEHDVQKFANGTNLFIADNSLYLLNMTASEAMKNLNVWFLTIRLGLNLSKTCYMVKDVYSQTLLLVRADVQQICSS